ncbi:hypothetical protein [Kosmotoga pacifica]|uniref:Fibronectin type-III domain-containing protein n=1 Tax=Kosmotoga pacifica TaxID=1330330 RepID=A0A0G2Z942_9BACT|nr:hypothetical protein [Kosmotoga pacifica]AKI96591.1 hypothetical protein IX53_00755 [Kosmotoga pacifica]
MPLTITSAAQTHLEGDITNVSPKIEVLWDGINWTDETAYLKDVNVNKSLEGENFGAVANTFNAILDNSTGRFSWPVQATRTPKKKVRIYADINGETVLVLTGVIDTINQRSDGTVLIKGRDLTALAIDTPAPLKTYQNQSPEAIIADLWFYATGYSIQAAATGIIFEMTKFTNATSAWDAISKICKQTAGRVNVLPDGTLKYESLIGKNYTPKTVADWTATTDKFVNPDESLSTKNIKNAILVEFKNKQIDSQKPVFMLLADPEGNSVQQEDDDRLINWNVGEILSEHHRAPADGVIYLKRGNVASITSVMNDTQQTDITSYATISDAATGKITLSGGFVEGDDIRFKYKVSSLTLAINYEYTPAEGWTFEGEVANPTLQTEFASGSANITLDTNPDPLLYPDADAVITIDTISADAVLSKLWIVGDIAVSRVEKFKKFDNTSIQTYGRRELSLQMEGISIDDARKVAQFLLDKYKNPISTMTVEITPHPELDVMDVIEIQDTIHTNVSQKYEITSVTLSLGVDTAKCSVQLRQYDSTTWTYTDNGITVTTTGSPVKMPLVIDAHQQTTAPSAPTGVSVIQGKSVVVVSWNKVPGNVAYYQVERDDGGGFVQIGITQGTQFVDSNVQYDTTYTYRVKAVDYAGNVSSPSTIASGSPQRNGFDDMEIALVLRVGQSISVGSILKLGYGVLSDGGDGILVNGANIEVIGQIDTDYLDLQKAVTVKPGTFIEVDNADSLFPSSITIYNTYVVEKTINFIVPVSVSTPKGTKNYYKYPLFKLSYAWNVDYGDFGGGYPGYAHGGDLTFEIIVDGETVFSEAQTDVWFRYYQNGNSQELDFYQLLLNKGLKPRENLPITFKLTIDDYKKDTFALDTVSSGTGGHFPYLTVSAWDVYPTLPVL